MRPGWYWQLAVFGCLRSFVAKNSHPAKFPATFGDLSGFVDRTKVSGTKIKIATRLTPQNCSAMVQIWFEILSFGDSDQIQFVLHKY
jgi:hypothetical protein